MPTISFSRALPTILWLRGLSNNWGTADMISICIILLQVSQLFQVPAVYAPAVFIDRINILIHEGDQQLLLIITGDTEDRMRRTRNNFLHQSNPGIIHPDFKGGHIYRITCLVQQVFYVTAACKNGQLLELVGFCSISHVLKFYKERKSIVLFLDPNRLNSGGDEVPSGIFNTHQVQRVKKCWSVQFGYD